MDRRINELINLTREKFNLHDYYLNSYHFFRNINIFGKTIYTLSMEWFPSHITDWKDEDSNPKGTACIDVDVKSLAFHHVIFVGNQSFAEQFPLNHLNKDQIITWIENEMGLIYGEQFQLVKEEEGAIHFKECIKGIAVSPSGFIEIKFNEEGKLTLFSFQGQFPSKEQIQVEAYTLSLDQIEDVAKEQVTLLELPLDAEERLIPAFAIEEIYIRNDRTSTIPYEFIVDEKSRLTINRLLKWEAPNQLPFQRTILSLLEEIKAEQAFTGEPHPDLKPITEHEVEKCIDAVLYFLRQQYSNDNEKWVLNTLHRDRGYIIATLKTTNQSHRVFQRKLKTFIDAQKYEVVNYMDNEMMLERYEGYEEAEEITLTKEIAYEKLKPLLELKPYYVYDFKQQRYLLCGKLDCQYAVNGSNGEVIALDDI
ncbi:hypothetical protein [Bacillus sp. AK128]